MPQYHKMKGPMLVKGSVFVTGTITATPPPAPVNTVPPIISGGLNTGSVLTVSFPGDWQNPVTHLAFQWLRGAATIAGATNSSYTAVAADETNLISCRVTASNAGGNSAPVSSNQLGPIAPNAPVNSVPPALSGALNVGSVLSVTNGTWQNTVTGYSYIWLRDGVPITGATAQTYTTVVADETHMISCRVTATNSTGNSPATSNALGPITP